MTVSAVRGTVLDRGARVGILRRRMPSTAAEPRMSRSLVRVGFGDTDLMGIVHHGKYACFFEMSRIEYMRRRGIDYARWASSGVHLAVIDLSIRYLRPAFFDELLLVECSLGATSGATVSFGYRLSRRVDQRLLVEGATVLACIGDNQKPRRLPTDLRRRLLGAETEPRPIDRV